MVDRGFSFRAGLDLRPSSKVSDRLLANPATEGCTVAMRQTDRDIYKSIDTVTGRATYNQIGHLNEFINLLIL